MKWYRLFESIEEANKIIPHGQVRKVIAGGREICVANTGKEFLAVQDECPHQRESLSKGRLNTFGEVICPLHSYRFDLKTGDETNARTPPADRFPMKLVDGKVMIGVI